MRISEKLLQAIYAKKPEGLSTKDEASFVAKELAKVEDREDKIARAKSKLNESEKKYNLAKEAYNKEMKEIRDSCDHLDTTFYADASGGSDSETICNFCNAEVVYCSKCKCYHTWLGKWEKSCLNSGK